MKGAVPLKWGNLYIRLDMHSEFIKEDSILLSNEVIQAYEVPAYLQENFNHPEIDEHEERRRKDLEERKLQRELAMQRKKLLVQLIDREKKIRDKIKDEEEDIRKDLTDALRKKLQDELDKDKKELEDIQKELDAALRKIAEEKLKNDQKKQIRRENMNKIVEDKQRTGIRVKLDKLGGGFRSKMLLKVVYGLFLDNEILVDDLGETMIYETQKYTEGLKKVNNKDGPLIKIELQKEEKEFVKNVQGLLYLNKSREREIWLGFQVIAIEPKREADVDEIVDIDDDNPLKDLPLPERETITLLGWSFFQVASTAGSLKDQSKKKDQKGKKTEIAMNKPPLLRHPYKASALAKTNIKLTFTFDTFIYDMDSLNYWADLRANKGKGNKDTFEKAKKKVYDKFYRDAFIPNSVPQFADLLFTKGSGIDVYVDASRFLPDNVTVTKGPTRAGLGHLQPHLQLPTRTASRELRPDAHDV